MSCLLGLRGKELPRLYPHWPKMAKALRPQGWQQCVFRVGQDTQGRRLPAGQPKKCSEPATKRLPFYIAKQKYIGLTILQTSFLALTCLALTFLIFPVRYTTNNVCFFC